MHSDADVGTREEKREFTLAEILRLKFLRFDGTGDPLQWIHLCERYFRGCRTPENKRVAYAAFHLLDGAQLWYHRLLGSPPTWEHFVLLIAARFGLRIKLGGGSSSADIPGSDDNLATGSDALVIGDCARNTGSTWTRATGFCAWTTKSAALTPTAMAAVFCMQLAALVTSWEAPSLLCAKKACWL
jgi:hypothetical protein